MDFLLKQRITLQSKKVPLEIKIARCNSHPINDDDTFLLILMQWLFERIQGRRFSLCPLVLEVCFLCFFLHAILLLSSASPLAVAPQSVRAQVASENNSAATG